VKEFWVYTALRLLLFISAFAATVAVWWLIDKNVPIWIAAVIAFAISMPASYVILNRPREAFAQRVTGRADRMVDRFEAARAKEDQG